MIKFGVHSLSLLKKRSIYTIFGGRKKVSASLLSEIVEDEESEQLYEEIALELVDDRGAYKRTYSSRFPDFDRLILETLLETQRSYCTELMFHDVAVSSAQTSVDLFGLLITEFPNLHFLATDYDPTLLEVRRGNLRVLLSSRNVPVEITYPPFVFTPRRLESLFFYPVNHVIRAFVTRYKVTPLMHDLMHGRVDNLSTTEVTLFSPSALRLASRTKQFELGKFDILNPPFPTRQFTCLRAMNVLNSGYFSQREMQKIIRNFHNSILPDGLLIAGSNQDRSSPVNGCIYRRTDAHFEPIKTLGNNTFLDASIQDFNRRYDVYAQ